MGEILKVRKSPKGLRLGVKLPPQAEAMRDNAKYQPYRVTLFVMDNQFAVDLRPVVYFIRCERANPHHACALADALWTRWEKRDKGILTRWPDTEDRAEAVVIDEGDWAEYWNDARKHGEAVYFVGDPRFPIFWTCPGMVWKDDLDKHLPEDYELHDSFVKSVNQG